MVNLFRIPTLYFAVFLLIATKATSSATAFYDSNFGEQLVVSGLSIPTAMGVLPDGRVIILEKQGKMILTDPNVANPTRTTIFTMANVEAEFERGLLTIAIDPDFSVNKYFYVYYTTKAYKLRLSRFTLTDNAAGNETVIWESQLVYSPTQSPYHFGGGMAVTKSGKIFLALGDMLLPDRAQNLAYEHGKLLRLNKDGSIPSDNPIANNPIYAWGLRNPFKGFYDEPTGTFIMGVVGGNDHNNSWEDIQYAKKGANYGWPNCGDTGRNSDGSCQDAKYTDPIYTFKHVPNRGNAIIGGFIYRNGNFPSAYQGVFFIADYAQSWIRYLQMDSNLNPNGTGTGESKAIDFKSASGGKGIVDLKQGTKGELLYLDIITGELRKIYYKSGVTLSITKATADKNLGTPPLEVQFSGAINYTGTGTLSYTWFFGDGQQSNMLSPKHTYNNPGNYKARLSVQASTGQSVSSEEIAITVGSPPIPQIVSPANGYFFKAGEIIAFSGTATDENTLTDANFKWDLLFKHDQHTHPGGITNYIGKSGTINIPTSGHSFHDETGYFLNLTVTNKNGLTATKTVTIYPKKVNVTYNTVPSGLTIYVDGQPRITPFVIDELQLFESEISVVSPQTLNGQNYDFKSWSDGGARTHIYKYPQVDNSLTATFEASTTSTPISVKYEAEQYYQIVTEQGSNAIKLLYVDVASTEKAISLFDAGDKVKIAFQTAKSGKYQLKARVRSGDKNKKDSYWPNGYAFTIDAIHTTFTGDLNSISTFSNDIGGAYWGEMVSPITNLATGTHVFTIASNSGWAAFDYLEVISLDNTTPTDQMPVVNAGGNKQLTLPTNSVVLAGSGSDPDGGTVTFLWKKISGGTATLSSMSSPSLTVGNMVEGVYIFELNVTDDEGNTVKDQATVTVGGVPTANGALVSFTLMNAETNQPISGFNPIANGAIINMTSLPTQKVNIRVNTNPTVVGSVKFELSSNNGGVTTSTKENTAPYALFGDASGNYNTWAAPGIQAGHSYQLAANAFELANMQGKEIGNLSIQFSFSGNITDQMPVVNAGGNKQLTLPTNSVVLAGSGSDPDGGTVTFLWKKISGGTATLGSMNSSSLTVSNMVEGVYVFELNVTDDEGNTAKDQASITVVKSTTSNAIVSFTLINAETNLPISGYDPIVNGMEINIAGLPTQKVNIRANTNPTVVGSVKFELSSNNGGVTTSTKENTAPYALFGDASGNYNAWAAPSIQAGHSYQLATNAFELANMQGKEIGNLSIQFSFTSGAKALSNLRLSENSFEENKEELGSITVFPNPTENELTIVFPENELDKTFFIYDVTGKVIYQEHSLKANESTLYLKDILISKGIYFIKFKIGNEIYVPRKILFL